jgi:branched-chain amino acid transport system permease protein
MGRSTKSILVLESLKEHRSTGILALILLVLPLVLPYTALATEVMIYGLAAVAFDLCLGYAGLMMFCQAAFFGTGVYVTGLVLIHLASNIFVAMFLGVLGSAILGLMIGYMATRRAGTYLVLLTFAFGELVFFIAYQWKSLTGGDDGLTGIVRPSLEIPEVLSISLQTPLRYYFFVFIVFIISFAIIKQVTLSPLGKAIQGVRENEARVQAIGYNTRFLKLIIFVLGATFMGLAGSLYSMFVCFAHIENVHFNTSANIVISELIGGMGSLYGPIIGAFIIVVSTDILSTVWQRWPILLGIICIVFVLFARGGIWGLLQVIGNRLVKVRMRSGGESMTREKREKEPFESYDEA